MSEGNRKMLGFFNFNVDTSSIYNILHLKYESAVAIGTFNKKKVLAGCTFLEH